MATFVLAHGGWGGGREWREVERRLRVNGHEATRPALTGLGERRHLLSPAVEPPTPTLAARTDYVLSEGDALLADDLLQHGESLIHYQLPSQVAAARKRFREVSQRVDQQPLSPAE